MLESAIVSECAMHRVRVQTALRKEAAYNDESTSSLLDLVRDLIVKNQFVSEVCRELAISRTETDNWQHKDELLYYDDVVYIPEDLRENVIRAHHDSSLVDHFDIERTLKLIRRKYYWSNQNSIEALEMRQQIKKHCETCVVCKRNKVARHKSYGEFSFFSISEFK